MQRFRDGFTELPPMRALGHRWDHDPPAQSTKPVTGGVAAELAAHGIDFSFMPCSTSITDRAR